MANLSDKVPPSGVALVDDGVPVGAIMCFAMITPPTSYLEAKGELISRSTYAALFAKIGTTYGAGDGSTTFVGGPDMRGEFPRGWDNGRGVDASRAIGSAQAEEFAEHQHRQNAYTETTVSNSPWGTEAASGSTYGRYVYNTTNSSSRFPLVSASGGSETRPRNVALMYCIKF